MKIDPQDRSSGKETARRDALLLKLLKTPPQPRPKRERHQKSRPKDNPNSKKEALAK